MAFQHMFKLLSKFKYAVLDTENLWLYGQDVNLKEADVATSLTRIHRLFFLSFDWLCQILCPVRVAKWVVRCRSFAEPQSLASIVVLTGQMCCLSLL